MHQQFFASKTTENIDEEKAQGRPRQNSDPGELPSLVIVDEGTKEVRQRRRQRSKSMFVQQEPVGQQHYSSLPPSPAVNFLSMLAEASNFVVAEDADDMLFGDIQPNDVLEKYQIVQRIGHGAFSECWSATNLETSSPVALKIVYGKPASRNITKFEREIAIWARLNHPGIVPLLDCFKCEDEGLMAAVMPLIEPGSLLAFMKNRFPSGLAPSDALTIFKRICLATGYLHTQMGLAHQDIKLENILIGADGQIFLADFGLCVELDEQQWETSTVRMTYIEETREELIQQGSVLYAPPEYFQSSFTIESVRQLSIAKKADIWALGVILYALLMGTFPFNEDFMPRLQDSITNVRFSRSLSEDLDIRIHALVAALLDADPAQRPDITDILAHPALCFADNP